MLLSVSAHKLACVDIDGERILLAGYFGLQLAQKYGLVLLNLEQPIWTACLIKRSKNIAYSSWTTDRNVLYLIDDKASQLATFSLQNPIERVVSSLECIGVSTNSQLIVLRSSDLVPLHRIEAGNGCHVVFSLSLQGLTLGYDIQEPGILELHTLTNTHLFDRFDELHNQSQLILQTQASQIGRNSAPRISYIRQPLKVRAFKGKRIDSVLISPSGFRAVVSAYQSLQFFSICCRTGALLQTFCLPNNPNGCLKTCSSDDGLTLAILSEHAEVFIYQWKPCKEEIYIATESDKKKFKFLPNNPTSLWRLMGFFTNSFKQQYPFAQGEIPFKPQATTESNLQQSQSLSAQSNLLINPIIHSQQKTHPQHIQAHNSQQSIKIDKNEVQDSASNYKLQQDQQLTIFKNSKVIKIDHNRTLYISFQGNLELLLTFRGQLWSFKYDQFSGGLIRQQSYAKQTSKIEEPFRK